MVRVIEAAEGLALWEPDRVAVIDSPFDTVAALVRAHGTLGAIGSYPVRRRAALEELTRTAPGVGAVWGVGLNYRSKAAATGRALPSDPILFSAATTALSPSGACVEIPQGRTVEMDYEGEIGVLIGAPLYRASSHDVWPAVAGITAVNDMTARDVMRSTQNPLLAKSFPGFKPVASSYASLDELRDPECIRLRSWVNGEQRQDDTSAAMIFPIPELVARLSQWVALSPGDLVLTGTPAGTGQDRGHFLQPGDEVHVEVDAVLPLITTVANPT